MEVTSYGVEDLMDRLHDYEREFGMSSAAFYRLHAEGRATDSVPPFDCVRWADTCRTVVRMASAPSTRSDQAPRTPMELVPAT